MKLKKLLPKKSKQGVTLVEAVFAVVILAMFATGVLTLLTTGRTKIAETNRDANIRAEATQVMDGIVAAISNGGYMATTARGGSEVVSTVPNERLKRADLIFHLSLDISASDLVVTKLDCYVDPGANSSTDPDNVRGWYLKLTYKGVTVKGYASNTQGVFDR